VIQFQQLREAAAAERGQEAATLAAAAQPVA
jgi:hypothetical protein